IWLTGLVGTGLIKYSMDTLVPSMTSHANYLEMKIGDSSQKVIESRVLAYRSRALHRDWVFGSFSLEGKKENVVVTQFRPDRSIDWEIRAERAIFTGSAGWLFEAGEFSQFDELGELLVAVPEVFKARRFPELSEKPEKIRNSLSPVEELSTSEIKLLLKNNEGMAKFTVAACKSTIYYRMFFPFACVIALLFAIPLSIKSGRGGMFANLGMAVGGMLSYYGVLQAFLVLGKKGFLSPLTSAIIPTAAYILFGMFLTYKKR
ncbi:MAG: LptF/LptG family permease, partial [Lentisphaeria bacterium]|nr:LptF/LptG family permease [Lentisphaeria bacterium]